MANGKHGGSVAKPSSTRQRVLRYLLLTPGPSSTGAIASALALRRRLVTKTLVDLARTGLVWNAALPGPREGLWFLSEEPTDGYLASQKWSVTLPEQRREWFQI